MNYIAKFNPYDMSDEVVLTVATGREKLLAEVLDVLKNNLLGDGSRQHLLLSGPRGMGKSFFLKYLQLQFQKKDLFQNCRFVLLPEEQNNVNSPSDFIRMIMAHLEDGHSLEVFTSWEESKEDWLRAFQSLKAYCKKQKSQHGSFLLIVVLENLNDFLEKIGKNKIAESRFRSLLEGLENFTLIGASPRANIDADYNKRLFKAFKPIPLHPWTDEDYFSYFDRRWDLHQEKKESPEEESKRIAQKNKLKAICQYTGGSPRMAVVLTDLLLEDDVLSTANTLYGLVDDLTPYYQDLTASMRPQSRKLFDTLIRAGENKSQSELAAILKTTQNKISKPFLWLLDNGYVKGKKRSDQKSFSYQVSDRIYVLYYQKREVYHNQNYTPIWLLSDFLLAFFEADELRQHALRFLKNQPSRDAIDLARVSMLARGMVEEELPEYGRGTSKEWLNILNGKMATINLILKEKIVALVNQVKDFVKHENSQIESLEEVLKKFISLYGKQTLSNEKLSVVVALVVVGEFLERSRKYTSAILFYQKLTSLDSTINDLVKAIILERIGLNFLFLGNLTESLSINQHVLKNTDNGSGGHAKAFGNLAIIDSLSGRKKEAWKKLKTYSGRKEKAFQQFGKIILYKERNEGVSSGFKSAIEILQELKNPLLGLNIPLSLSYLFVILLHQKITPSLFQDITEEALLMFPSLTTQASIKAALHTITFIENGEKISFLEKLPPDEAIAIKAIVHELKLISL